MVQKDPGLSQAKAHLKSTFHREVWWLNPTCSKGALFWHIKDTIIGPQSSSCPHMHSFSANGDLISTPSLSFLDVFLHLH